MYKAKKNASFHYKNANMEGSMQMVTSEYKSNQVSPRKYGPMAADGHTSPSTTRASELSF